MSTAIKIEIGATLWRNGSDGEPQVRLILPDGEPVLLRVRKSSPKAYALCVAALDAAADAEASEAGSTFAERVSDFQWHKVEFPSE
jgi:hypothetical protein